MLNDQEWKLEEARCTLEYWDHRVAQAKKELRKAIIWFVLVVATFIAECTLVFIYCPFWLGVLIISVGAIVGIGLHHLKERLNAAS